MTTSTKTSNKPKAKATRLNRETSGQRRGYFKTPFINMRGEQIGHWLVMDYLYAEDHPGETYQTIDEETGEEVETHGWTDHFWSVQCVECRNTTFLERRQIRKERPILCAVCKERDRAERELEQAKAKAAAQATSNKPTVDLKTIKALTEAGSMSNVAMGKLLGITR
jgi:hypothetical protein